MPARPHANLSAVAASTMLEHLRAEGPFPEHRDALMLFGQLVGAWEFDLVNYHPDGRVETAQGEWHFDWILGGRGIQDVWMVPTRAEQDRARVAPRGYGTTVRLYDPALGAWRVVWASALGGQIAFVAREAGDEIVMDADVAAGEPALRWIFSEIGPESFSWRAVVQDGDGAWNPIQKFYVRRVSGDSTVS